MERVIDQYLEKLKKRVLKMCSLVDEQVQSAIRAVREDNLQLAKEIIEKEDKVDKYDNKIDKICQKIFALTQPVAMDLRQIMSSMTINNNLERIGDIAANIANYILIIKKKPDFYYKSNLEEMFTVVQKMLRDAIDSYINGNEMLAKTVIDTDDQLDKLNFENYKIFIDIMKENQDNIEPAVALLVMSRQIERLGDHCTNIAEDVFFIFQAHLVKHKYEKYLFADEKDEDDD